MQSNDDSLLDFLLLDINIALHLCDVNVTYHLLAQDIVQILLHLVEGCFTSEESQMVLNIVQIINKHPTSDLMIERRSLMTQ